MTKPDENIKIYTLIYTIIAMVAFAANSILCRFALGEPSIDASSFSSLRIISGASTLWIILKFTTKTSKPENKNIWKMASMLVLYAVAFSFAYLSLSAGTGALILFGAVQSTMLITGWIKGERLNTIQWTGLITAVAGLIYLVLPGLETPSLPGALLMALAGIAWGFYSLLGKKAGDPVTATAYNFIYSVPIVLIIGFIINAPVHLTIKGVTAAVVSGAVTSGTGYVIWYKAIKGLTATKAAIVQLTVPVIAAIGGLIFLSENLTLRLIISGTAILAGVALALGSKKT